MPLTIANRNIQRVKIFDDDPKAREMVALNILDAKLEAVMETGPLPGLKKFTAQVMETADAAILDHRLKLVGKYARFDGAEAVAYLYTNKFPAVLCTAYSKADIDSMRRFRKQIPSLIPTDNVEPETIVAGLARCIQEFNGYFAPSRRPWRTLVRVEDVTVNPGYKMFYAVIPAWTSSDIVRLPLDLIPGRNRRKIRPGARFTAEVNIGANNQDDLYFDGFEFD